ncbi:MAG: sensor histidine kinase [Planctomycetota bacterium]
MNPASDDNTLRSAVVDAMGLLVAARTSGDQTFRWIGRVPLWAQAFGCRDHLPCDPAASFAFLDFFLGEAQRFWGAAGPDQPEVLRSEVWSEPDRHGVDHQLEALALRVQGQAVLVVAGVGLDFLQAQNILQTARERRLTTDQELAVRARVERELRGRVAQRTAELTTANRQLRALASQVALAEQRERHRLATGLHDHVGQLLAVTRLRLADEQARADSPDSPDSNPDAAERLAVTLTLLQDAIDATRSLTFQLSPPTLYELGLLPTLASLVDQTARLRPDLVCAFDSEVADLELPDDLGILLFQAVRELITNTLKHAHATRLELTARLQPEPDTLVITVADDGIGLDPDTLDRPVTGPGGFGLRSIHQRLSHLGATLLLDSPARGGTVARIVVPLGNR